MKKLCILGILAIGLSNVAFASQPAKSHSGPMEPVYDVDISLKGNGDIWKRHFSIPLYQSEDINDIKTADGNSALHFTLFNQKDGGISANIVTGQYGMVSDNKCLSNQIEQDGCTSGYKYLDNRFVVFGKEQTKKVDLVSVSDGVQRSIVISIHKTGNMVSVVHPVQPPLYDIRLRMTSDMLPDFFGKQAEFSLTGGNGEELAYGSSIIKKYINGFMKPDLTDTHYGILGAVILKPYNPDEKKNIGVEDDRVRDVTALVSLDMGHIGKNEDGSTYPGYGKPNIEGIQRTVRADIPYGQWIQFGKSIKDCIMYINVSPTLASPPNSVSATPVR